MSSHDDEIAAANSVDGALEPPIWVSLEDIVEPSAQVRPARMASRIGLQFAVAFAGSVVVLLAGAVVVGIIGGTGPAAGLGPAAPVAATQPAAARRPAAAKPAIAKAGTAKSPTAQPATPKPGSSAAALPTLSCKYPPTGARSVPRQATRPRSTGVVKSGQVAVKVVTDRGQLDFSLDRAKTPCTVNSFLSLANQGFFDATPCHRLTTREIFVLQCGDPSGTGRGGPGYSFPDENLPRGRSSLVTYPAGTIAMVSAGPSTNGSQFFIVYEDSRLLPTWTIFGRVTSGLDLVRVIAATGSASRPRNPVTIRSVTSAPAAR